MYTITLTKSCDIHSEIHVKNIIYIYIFIVILEIALYLYLHNARY